MSADSRASDVWDPPVWSSSSSSSSSSAEGLVAGAPCDGNRDVDSVTTELAAMNVYRQDNIIGDGVDAIEPRMSDVADEDIGVSSLHACCHI